MTPEPTQTLSVAGMTCGGCAKRLDLALRKVPGVSDVTVTLPDQAVVVGRPDAQALQAAIEKAGFTVG